MNPLRSRRLWAILALLALALCVLGVGGALLGVSMKGPQWLKATLDRTSPDGTADAFDTVRVEAIVKSARKFGMLYVGVALALAICAFVLPVRRVAARVVVGFKAYALSSFAALLRFPKREPVVALILLAIMVAGLAARLTFLHQEIRGDEAANYMQFARRHIGFAISDYAHPNNHLLFTLMSHACDRVFGGAVWSMRLPVLVFGTLLVPATFVLCGALYRHREAALLAAALVAFQPYLVFYSTSARGYTLVALATVVCLILARRILHSPTWTRCTLFAITGALGFFAIPTMLIPFAGTCLWIGIEAIVTRSKVGNIRLFTRMFVAGLGTIALTVAFYTPVFVVSGIESVTSNKFVERMSDSLFKEELSKRTLQFLDYTNAGLPAAVAWGMLALAVLGLVLHPKISRHRVPVAIVLVLWSIAFVYLKHAVPYGRTWTCFLPLYCVLAGAGLMGIVSLLERRATARAQVGGVVGLMAAAVLAVPLWKSRAVERIPEGDLFTAPREVVAFAKEQMKPGERMLMTWPALPAVEYYAYVMGLSESYITRDGNVPYTHCVIEGDVPFVLFNEKLDFGGLGPISKEQMSVARELSSGAIYRLTPALSAEKREPRMRHMGK